jgi:hypothetical protein
MGERGFTLLHLIQKLSDQQEYVGQWHDHLNFIATYHRSAVAEGFDKFIQGHTAPRLYISNELENIQMTAPASPRPPAPAKRMFESPNSVQGDAASACLDPAVKDLTHDLEDLNPFPSPNKSAVLVLVHVNSVPSTHYVWMMPDGRMFDRHGTIFHDLDDFQRSMWPTTVTSTELAHTVESTLSDVRLMPIIAIANAFRKVVSLKNRFWFDSCASSSISFDPSDFVALRRVAIPINVTVATGPDAQINFIGDIILEFREGNQNDPDEVYRVEHVNVLWYPLAHSKLLCAKKLVRSLASSQPGASAQFVMEAQSDNGSIESGYVQVSSNGESRRFELEYLGPEDNECPASNATCVTDPIFAGYHEMTPAQQQACVDKMLEVTAARDAEDDRVMTYASLAIVESTPESKVGDEVEWPPTPSDSLLADLDNLAAESNMSRPNTQPSDTVNTSDGKYQFRKVPYGSPVSPTQHFDHTMALGKRTKAPIVSLHAASTSDHDISKFDGHSTVRNGYNPILDHTAVTKDKVAYAEQKIPMMEEAYRWNRPQPDDFPISAPNYQAR